jgi:uncharacterized protein YcbK (DUF882 family)
MTIDPYQISPNFSSGETQCHCDDSNCQFGARMVPDPRRPGKYRSEMHPLVMRGLEELRADACELAGEDAPIILTSAARCPNHNYAVGGHPNSYHLCCRAVDVTCPKLTIQQLHKLTKKNSVFSKHGIGLNVDKHFIHLDVGPLNHFTYARSADDHKRDTKDGEYVELIDGKEEKKAGAMKADVVKTKSDAKPVEVPKDEKKIPPAGRSLKKTK